MDTQLIANTPQEEALIRIRSLQVQNATAAQRGKIENLEKKIYRYFLNSIETKYGLSRKQLLEFRDDEIESLFEIVQISAKRKAIIAGILVWTFGLLIPVGGWMWLLFMHSDEDPASYFYMISCRNLRKILGDKYFSAKRLRELNIL